MVVLLFLLPTHGAGPEKAWKFAGQAMKKVHCRLLKTGSDRPRKFNELTPDLCTSRSSRNAFTGPQVKRPEHATAFSDASVRIVICPARLSMLRQFEIAAATPRGEAREKYLPVEMYNLSCFAQKRLTAIAPTRHDPSWRSGLVFRQVFRHQPRMRRAKQIVASAGGLESCGRAKLRRRYTSALDTCHRGSIGLRLRCWRGG